MKSESELSRCEDRRRVGKKGDDERERMVLLKVGRYVKKNEKRKV